MSCSYCPGCSAAALSPINSDEAFTLKLKSYNLITFLKQLETKHLRMNPYGTFKYALLQYACVVHTMFMLQPMGSSRTSKAMQDCVCISLAGL